MGKPRHLLRQRGQHLHRHAGSAGNEFFIAFSVERLNHVPAETLWMGRLLRMLTFNSNSAVMAANQLRSRAEVEAKVGRQHCLNLSKMILPATSRQLLATRASVGGLLLVICEDGELAIVCAVMACMYQRSPLIAQRGIFLSLQARQTLPRFRSSDLFLWKTLDI